MSFCYLMAMRSMSVGMASVVVFAYPVLAAVGGWALLREPFTARLWAGLALGIAGVLLIAAAPGHVTAEGVLWALGGAVSYAAYVLASRRWPAQDLGVRAFAIMAGGGIAFGLAALVAGSPWPQGVGWFAALGLGLFGAALGVLLFQAGIRWLAAGEAAALTLLDPATTVLLGVAWLGERPGAQELAGAVLVLGAFLVTQVSRPGSGPRQPLGVVEPRRRGRLRAPWHGGSDGKR